MKVLFWLAVIGGLGYLFYQEIYTDYSRPMEITDPVYGQFRLNISFPDRELKWDFFVKYASFDECRQRIGGNMPEMLEDCEICEVTRSECKKELDSRQMAMFRNEPHFVTYLAGTAGNGTERDGRLIIWGLSKAEAEIACRAMLKDVATHYSGKLECI
ncbi:MAG TPA: hypothetical protein ENJ01_12915 [Gammaproteobacteria bacterium]|nr:hypothetical protein [Gammaproteobacteria bacterium]